MEVLIGIFVTILIIVAALLIHLALEITMMSKQERDLMRFLYKTDRGDQFWNNYQDKVPFGAVIILVWGVVLIGVYFAI